MSSQSRLANLKMFTNYIYLIDMYKKDLALNNQQWLVCHKTKPNQTKPRTWDSLSVQGVISGQFVFFIGVLIFCWGKGLYLLSSIEGRISWCGRTVIVFMIINYPISLLFVFIYLSLFIIYLSIYLSLHYLSNYQSIFAQPLPPLSRYDLTLIFYRFKFKVFLLLDWLP